MDETKSIPDCVYHYCSVRALHGIVTSGRFRLGNVFFMNDYMEVEWFKQICRSILEENRDRITKTTHTVHSPPAVSAGGGVTSSSSSSSSISIAHARFYDRLMIELSKRAFDHVYCGCFSEVSDDLSQWRGYADDGRGVALGVNLQQIIDANKQARAPTDEGLVLEANPVEYVEKIHRKHATEIIIPMAESLPAGEAVEGIAQAAFAFARLRPLAPRFKNPKFTGEREIRLVSHDTQFSNFVEKAEYNPVRLGMLPSDVRFYERKGKLVPFVEVTIPPEAVREVWVGPCFGDALDESALLLFLTKHQITAPIKRSKASYR